MKNSLKTLATGLLCFGVVACNSSNSPVAPSSTATSPTSLEARPGSAGQPAAAAAAKPGNQTIVGIVVGNSDFDVLRTAVIRAELVDALNGSKQLTVFAPTDAAFQRTLGVASEAEAIDAVNALPLEVLTDILLFHVTEGRRISTSVLAAPRYTMLNGKTLTREQLSAAGIAATDISASNGIIHVIENVLIPGE